MKIAVLLGGISPERNVSLTGGKAVAEALKRLGHQVVTIDPALGAECIIDMDNYDIPSGYPTEEELKTYPGKNIIECLNSDVFNDIEAAFILLHGKNGEDGRIQSLLELREIPYTGSKVKASSIAMDKLTSKLLFIAAGIQTPEWMPFRKDDIGNYESYEQIRTELGNNIIVKPNNQGSTIGITHVTSGNLDDIDAAVKKAYNHSNVVLIEQFIEGRELTVGILGEEALPIIEIIPEGGFYDYEHKYIKGKTTYECPADIYADIDTFTRNAAYTAFRILGCNGFGRVDFRMDEEGQVFCLEVNTIPGFTETSLVPMAAKSLDIDFDKLCEEILNSALEN